MFGKLSKAEQKLDFTPARHHVGSMNLLDMFVRVCVWADTWRNLPTNTSCDVCHNIWDSIVIPQSSPFFFSLHTHLRLHNGNYGHSWCNSFIYLHPFSPKLEMVYVSSYLIYSTECIFFFTHYKHLDHYRAFIL